MNFQEFRGSAGARQRYWGRALAGWRMFATVEPNAGHRALARLEAAGHLDCVITQNVDGLHQRAGSRNVIDLHGRVDAVECLDCRERSPRAALQAALERSNPGWMDQAGQIAPDGDAVLEHADFSHFEVPDCEACGGTLKPAVVFFGEPVPRPRVARAMAAVAGAEGLLVAGTSLMVYSGYRFVRAARAQGVPVAIVNLGCTRADHEADLRLVGPCGPLLDAAVQHSMDPKAARPDPMHRVGAGGENRSCSRLTREPGDSLTKSR